ncbi:MAG: DDE-type integrase/transposase/recombinase [Candidatus Nitrosocosmicus sp.]
MHIKRNRTPLKYIGYGLYLYFLGLSYRNTSKALAQFVKRSHVAIWKWIQRYKPKKIARKRKRISEFIIDETLVKIGSAYMWIWVAIELKSKEILALNISKERNMLIAERFISSLVQIHGIHPVSTDGGTWYPMACRFLNLNHHINSSLEKSLIERTMQYIKDRTECFDDYFPCRIKNCKLKHVQNWLNQFAYQHNKKISH